jgi:hypothetical protein
MSTAPEADFDLEKLFLPAWAQESSAVNRYAKYQGDERPPDRDRKFDDRRGPRRGPPRDGGAPANRGGHPPRRDLPQGPRREGDRPERDRRGPGGPGGPRRDGRRDNRGERRDRPERREPVAPLPEVAVTFLPDDKGVESLSRQIKMSGRSFPLFDIAHMILQKPERHLARFESKPKPEGQPTQGLFVCAIDDTLWLSEDEAVDHVLSKHFGMFYNADKTPTDPPKGTYTFVAQCGMSGTILGPPNYHDYQNQLRKLHAERFSRMPFEAFKSRVRIVRDEAVVKKWIEDQSVKTEYVCLNVPEASRLTSREDVEKHFREVHLPNIVKKVEKHTMTGAAGRQLRSPGLQRLLRFAWEEQRRFPLQIATVLSQQFAAHGLQFFKVNKTVTHVSVARPHYLDLELTPVSDQVKQIVVFIDAHPKCTRRSLIETLAPSPPETVKAESAPGPTTETAAAPAQESGTPAAAPEAPVADAGPTSEQAAIIGDLHWLIHQGHVIEFANGILETAKKPVVRPPKAPRAVPAPAPVSQPSEAAVEGSAVPAPEGEGAFSGAENTAATEEVQAIPVSTDESQSAIPPSPDHSPTDVIAPPGSVSEAVTPAPAS